VSVRRARALQAFLRASAASGRTVVPVPPFTAFVDESDALKYRSYGIPDGDVRPAAADVAALREAFRARDRLPRLEWVEEAAPRVAAALDAEGMREELRTPLMTCGPGQLAPAEAAVDDLAVSAVSDADRRETAELQRAAFGLEPLGEGEAPWSSARPHGGGVVLARAGGPAGTPVAAAVWTRVVDGCSEVAGVATAEPWRRRGLAGVVTAAAARAAFGAGAGLCVLSPGDETAQRVYARAGFRRAATMLHWSDPD
jgi:GNAT superfamily N-acetyltransferase